MISSNPSHRMRNWLLQAVLAALAAYFYVFMEWLFFVTKPSFMSVLSALDSVKVLFAAPLPLAVTGAAAVFILWVAARLIRRRIVESIALTAARLIPAAILAGAMILLLDNFTYTVLDFGIRTAGGVLLHVYAAMLVLLLFASWCVLGALGRILAAPAMFRAAVVATPALVVLSIVAALLSSDSSGLSGPGGLTGSASAEERPNIILLSSDGLNAGHMSIYGYHRRTTPFLESLAADALVCENCFPNAGTSGASIASMLTGKLPTQTRLVYPPEILTGKDAYQHLPGILRHYGYYNVDISIRLHADPVDLNLRNSFHWANFRDITERHAFDRMNIVIGQEAAYFVGRMSDRITERLLHVTGIRRMGDPLGEVVERGGKRFNRDGDRIKALLRHLGNHPSSLFVHIHLLGTHGPTFKPARRVFSRGEEQTGDWMTDFYDDAILSFDNDVKSIVRALTKQGILDNTVIVIFSDHGQLFSVNTRLPLIFIFPKGHYRGRMTANVQNLDIAATILGYLDIEQPGWMGGQSLLSSEIDPLRIIYTADPKHRIIRGRDPEVEADGRISEPPFYSLKAMGFVCCHKHFELNLGERILTVSDIEGHTAPCVEDALPSPEEAGRMIIDHLESNGYDTSPIGEPLIIRHSP